MFKCPVNTQLPAEKFLLHLALTYPCSTGTPDPWATNDPALACCGGWAHTAPTRLNAPHPSTSGNSIRSSKPCSTVISFANPPPGLDLSLLAERVALFCVSTALCSDLMARRLKYGTEARCVRGRLCPMIGAAPHAELVQRRLLSTAPRSFIGERSLKKA